jgi:hypothetical protein
VSADDLGICLSQHPKQRGPEVLLSSLQTACCSIGSYHMYIHVHVRLVLSVQLSNIGIVKTLHVALAALAHCRCINK